MRSRVTLDLIMTATDWHLLNGNLSPLEQRHILIWANSLHHPTATWRIHLNEQPGPPTKPNYQCHLTCKSPVRVIGYWPSLTSCVTPSVYKSLLYEPTMSSLDLFLWRPLTWSAHQGQHYYRRAEPAQDGSAAPASPADDNPYIILWFQPWTSYSNIQLLFHRLRLFTKHESSWKILKIILIFGITVDNWGLFYSQYLYETKDSVYDTGAEHNRKSEYFCFYIHTYILFTLINTQREKH